MDKVFVDTYLNILKGKKVIKESEDVEYNLDSDSYDAVFNIFKDCIEFDVENSEYDLGNVDVYELAKEYFGDCLADSEVQEKLQAYIADTEGKTDSISELNEAMNYWVMDNIIGDLENKASFGDDWQWS